MRCRGMCRVWYDDVQKKGGCGPSETKKYAEKDTSKVGEKRRAKELEPKESDEGGNADEKGKEGGMVRGETR